MCFLNSKGSALFEACAIWNADRLEIVPLSSILSDVFATSSIVGIIKGYFVLI